MERTCPSLYYKMERYEATLSEYIDFISDYEMDPSLSIRRGIAVQICFGVLAGQSIFNLYFSDLKPDNIMLDGSCTSKYYLMSMGSQVLVFASATENGYGTVKLIDNSTTIVGPSNVVSSYRDVTTRSLTPLEYFLLEKYLGGFHRDMHNISLTLVGMFGAAPLASLRTVWNPTELEDVMIEWEGESFHTDYLAEVCYQQIVLLSKRNRSILDILADDATFSQNPKFQEVFEAMKPVLTSLKFVNDVREFSLLDGTAFCPMRNKLGSDKVKLLWRAMLPNAALRLTLPEFMLGFFEDTNMTVLDKPEEQLRTWYEETVGEDDEVIPLFLDEAHASLCFGEEKDSFVLKSDRVDGEWV